MKALEGEVLGGEHAKVPGINASPRKVNTYGAIACATVTFTIS